MLLCSFCGKSQRDVAKLIAGPGVYICNECIALCQEILDEEAGAEPPPAAGETPHRTPAPSSDETPDRTRLPGIERALDEGMLLEHLDPLEHCVLDLRYGLSGTPPRTLDEVASKLGLTPDGVKAIEMRSLAKLRASSEQPPSD